MTRVSLALSLFIFLLSAFNARADVSPQAEPEACLSEALVNEIRAQVELTLSDSDTFDRCQPGSKTYMVLQTLILIKTMQYSDQELGEPFSQGILPGDFWGYFSTRTKSIVEETSCRPGILAYVYGLTHDGQIHVCPDWFLPSTIKYERAQVMLHEVRHFEGFRHVTCKRGQRQGQSGACDDSIEEKGSYAVTVEVLTKMALNSKDIPRVQKTLLKSLAVSFANDAFNAPVSPQDLTAFYLETTDHHAYMFSHKGLLEVASLGDSKIVSRTQSLVVFPPDKGDAYSANVFSTQLDPAPPQGSVATTYNSTPRANRANMIDILNLGYLAVSVTDSQLAGQLESDGADTMVDLPWKAVAAFSGAEVGIPDTDSLYVLNEKRELFRVQFVGYPNYHITPVANSLGAFNQFVIYQGQRLGLTDSGQVLTAKDGTWAVFEGLKGLQVKRLTRPFSWDQYFEDIEPGPKELQAAL